MLIMQDSRLRIGLIRGLIGGMLTILKGIFSGFRLGGSGLGNAAGVPFRSVSFPYGALKIKEAR